MVASTNKAYILLSGGQDSFVCLIWALQHFSEVEAVSIAYNQRHAKEIEYAKKIAAHLSTCRYYLKHSKLDLLSLQLLKYRFYQWLHHTWRLVWSR